MPGSLRTPVTPPASSNKRRFEDMNTLLEARRDHVVFSSTRRPVDRSTHILVVDDDREIRQFSTGALALHYRVDAAEDGAAAWTALNAKRYDLLITDNHMPKLSGVQLVGKLRYARLTVPVILVSGVVPANELDRNLWLQIAARLEKPFSSGQLLETVEAVLLAADDYRCRAAACFPVSTADFRHVAQATKWGINE
jgi:DNA-binding response OmpR family regulator